MEVKIQWFSVLQDKEQQELYDAKLISRIMRAAAFNLYKLKSADMDFTPLEEDALVIADKLSFDITD